MAFHAHLVNFSPLYNVALLAIFNNQIFTKQNQSSTFIKVFVQNEANNFMYACDGTLLYPLCDFDDDSNSLWSTSLYLFSRYLRDVKNKALSVEYIKEQHLYWILIPSVHILLSFCVRIGAFDRFCVFVLLQVFRVPFTLIVGVHIQRTDEGHCG